MRVIAGSVKGIPLKAVPGQTTRPTTDKVKESLFNIIGPYFDGGNVLDLFAGSGGLGIEALSRGIDHAVFIDRDRKAIETIRANLDKTRLSGQAEILRADAKQAIKVLKKNGFRARLLFMDPPYNQPAFYELMDFAAEQGIVTEDVLVVCEHDKGVELEDRTAYFQNIRKEQYGGTVISIYLRQKEEGDGIE